MRIKIRNTIKLPIFLILILGVLVRVLGLNQLPPAPYWEEVALGYDAYSLLKTGHDHHGNFLPIVALESFGDYKPALYAYTIIPFLLVFDLSVVAVRAPSVIAGIFTIMGIGLLIQELSHWLKPQLNSKFAQTWFISGLAIASVSPWLIQFSRGGWETNLATTLITYGVWSGIRGSRQSNATSWLKWMVISAVMLIMSMYTYHAARIIAPLLGLTVIGYQLPQLIKHKLQVGILGGLCLILLTPLLSSLFSNQISHRWQETSILTDISIIEASNEYQQLFHFHPLAKLFFHRYWFYAGAISQNAVSHARLDYLFVTGDSNPRHSVGLVGIFYPLDAVLLGMGLINLWQKNRKILALLAIWIMIGIFPAALAYGAPHALRTLATAPALITLAAVGLVEILTLLKNFRKYRLIRDVIFVGYGLQVVFWTIVYTQIYPLQAAHEWQFGYQAMIEQLTELRQNHEPVIMTREQGRPAMYYWFYSKTDPRLVQQAEPQAPQDQGEFLAYDGINFVRGLSGNEQGLIVSGPEQAQKIINRKTLTVIKDLQGQPIWEIFRVGETN